VALQRILKNAPKAHNIDVYLSDKYLVIESPEYLTITIRVELPDESSDRLGKASTIVGKKFFSNPSTEAPIWFDKVDGVQALRLVGTMAPPRTPTTYLTGMVGALKLKCVHPDFGFGQTEIPAYVPEEHIGREFIINLKYLKDAVSSCETANVPVVVGSDMLHIGEHLVMLMRP
jgi:hypothetical protein